MPTIVAALTALAMGWYLGFSSIANSRPLTAEASPSSPKGPAKQAQATFNDPIGDADGGLAADISVVVVDHDAEGTIVFNVAYTNRSCVGGGDGVYVYVDVDRNRGTGGPFLGVEYVLILSGSTRQVWATRWNGVAREEVHPPSLRATCDGSTSSDRIQISRFDIGVSTDFDFLVGTEFLPGGGSAFFDTALDCCAGRWTYLLVAPPPAAAAQCTVPDVRGKSLPGAKAALAKANCKLGKTRRVYSSRVEKGRVISQRPAPGSRRANRYEVDLTLSRGPRP